MPPEVSESPELTAETKIEQWNPVPARLSERTGSIYCLFYKPAGCVTARRDDRYPVVLDYIPHDDYPRLTHVGRLDRETEGLLLLTDDGIWCQQILNPAEGKEKEYEFLVLGDLTLDKKRQLEEGILLGGENHRKKTAPARIRITKRTILQEVSGSLYKEVQEKISKNKPDTPVTGGTIIITEGRKNQIRRMMKQAGCFVIFLKRVRIGQIYLPQGMKPGEYYMTENVSDFVKPGFHCGKNPLG